MRRLRRSGDEGFALIESVAVLMLSALVLLTMLIAGDLVTRNAAAASRRAHEVETLATGFAAVKRDVSRAMFMRAEAGADTPILFQGTPGTLGFVVERDRPDLGYSGSLVWMEARYEDGRGILERSSARLLPQTAGFAGVAFSDPAVLLSGPWTYRFSYAQSTPELQWVESWSNPAGLPDAVRLEVLDSASQPVVPPLVAKLRIDAELNCELSEYGCPDEESDEFGDEGFDDEADNEE